MLDIRKLAMQYDVRIVRTSTPGVGGVSTKMGDGYLVVVEAYLEGKALAKALDHEFLHIILGHHDEFYEKPLYIKEREVEEALNHLWAS